MFLVSNLSSPTWVEKALLEVSISPAGCCYRPEEREKKRRRKREVEKAGHWWEVLPPARTGGSPATPDLWPNTKVVTESLLPSMCRGDRIQPQAALNKDESTRHTLCTMELMRERNDEAGRGRQKFQNVSVVGRGGRS